MNNLWLMPLFMMLNTQKLIDFSFINNYKQYNEYYRYGDDK